MPAFEDFLRSKKLIALVLGLSAMPPLALLATKAGAAPATLLVDHRWSDSAKESVGTAYGSESSRVWFTVGHGILNEVYFPRIDKAQVADSQLLFANVPGKTFLEEKRDFEHQITHPPAIPRPVIHSVYDDGHSRIDFTKEIVTDPDAPVLRTRYHFTSLPSGAKVYILHKTAAGNDGAHDQGRAVINEKGSLLFSVCDAEVAAQCHALTTTARVERASVGIVGETDGWQDLNRYGRMVSEIDKNGPDNIALTAELKSGTTDFEVILSFGSDHSDVANVLMQKTTVKFTDVLKNYDTGWKNYLSRLAQSSWLDGLSDKLVEDLLWNAAIIKTHEDKSNPGAIIASLSIPYLPTGGGHPDGKDTGGYHLVWPRDLFKSALALLRLGDVRTSYNILIFMSQMETNGRMTQNAWIDGKPFWTGEQMDQEAFPVLLAVELTQAGVQIEAAALKSFLDRRVARLQQSIGRTGQERWEEASGFSPNTMAVMAAALSRIGDQIGAKRILDAALQKTIARNGPLSRDPYFVRISQNGSPDAGETLYIANGGPALPEYRVLDGGFLEWLRWFPNPEKSFGQSGRVLEQVINNTIALYDNPANGASEYYGEIPLYRRYNSDAYGLNKVGGPWPILTAERALPVLRNNPKQGLKFVQYVRNLWGQGDLCPEQLAPNKAPMPFGASPLVWCHAEMVELVFRSATSARE